MASSYYAVGENDDEEILRKASSSLSSSSASSGIGSAITEDFAMASAADPDGDSGRKSPLRLNAPFRPPDGGLRAWLVVLCSFLTNGVIFGTINSFGTLFVELKAELEEDDPTASAAAKASLVGAMAVGATFAVSPVSGALADRFGIRRTAFFGGFVATCGMLASSFVIKNFAALCFTYGIMFGAGSSLCYTPSLAILAHYFQRHIGVVNGFVAAGSSIFTMAMPFVLKALLDAIGMANTLRYLAAQTSFLMLAAVMFKPLIPEQPANNDSDDNVNCCSKIFKFENLRNKKYMIWSLAIPSALFGYFVPYVHIVAYVKDILPAYDGNRLVFCIGVTSGLGRLLFGKISDSPRVNRVFLQQISFVSIGLCTMLLTLAPLIGSEDVGFGVMTAFALIMGLFDGCFITMIPPIAIDICGKENASQAIGFILGLCSIPLTVGPPIAGLLKDNLGNYTVAFLAAGCPPIIGAVVMTLIYRVGNNQAETEAEIEEDRQAENAGLLPPTATTTTIVAEEDRTELEKGN